MISLTDISEQTANRWPAVGIAFDQGDHVCELSCPSERLPDISSWLFGDLGFNFGGMIVEQGNSQWQLRYVFYDRVGAGRIDLIVTDSLGKETFPSIIDTVHAADWHEREVADHFGLVFEGHPKLGDFVLHDDRWQEGLEPMRHHFDGRQPVKERHPDLDNHRKRILNAPGAFAMPVGPIFSGANEPVHFQLETVGEEVIRTIPRLFYKYRGVEKTAQGRTPEEALLLAERFCGTSAFAHGLAFCQAAETISHIEVPKRAERLRVFSAELERFRHHIGAIESICNSTGLAVGTAQSAILHEDLLRLSGALTGHRYLFGLLQIGGLTRDIETSHCQEALAEIRRSGLKLKELEQMLIFTSTFLDRLEKVGVTTHTDTLQYGLVGPVARAAGVDCDIRKALSYCGYDERVAFDIPVETEGDGYARLRILFAEAQQSLRIMEQVITTLPDGPVTSQQKRCAGAALGWAEAPRGAAFHWLRIDKDGRVARYRIMPPSFMNWHGFHLAAENFAFQDFPIILATFDLSAAESDR